MTHENKLPSKKDASIIIVGAGIAGISAAHRLLGAGFRNVKILEASDRKGGRICTKTFGKNCEKEAVIELGANWIQGMGTKNSVFELADSANLLRPFIFSDRSSSYFYNQDGRQLNLALSKKAWEVFQNATADMDHFRTTDEKQNCQQYLKDRFEKDLTQFEKTERDDVRAIFHCFLNYLAVDVGDDLDKVSLRYFGCYEEIEGGNVKIPGGYSGVLDKITDCFPEETIYYHTKVSTIRWKEISNQKHSVRIICQSADDETTTRTYEADHVIVTCSLGVLKQHHSELFYPSLSHEKTDAIKRLGYGVVDKIFLEYEKQFWEFEGESVMKPAWNNTKDLDHDVKKWHRYIFSFDKVLNNDNVLLAWIYGYSAEYTGNLSDDEITKTCTTLLRQFLNDNTIPEPTRVLRSKWKSNPLTLGSYSYIAVGATQEHILQLAEPLYIDGVPVVMFAGEATHATYFGTTHGARATGLREAERLIHLYRS